MSDEPRTSADSRLTEQVRRLVDAIVRRAWINESGALIVQAASLTIHGGPITMLKLDVHDGFAVKQASDLLPGRVFVRTNGDLLGELMVWLTDGLISQLEYAWYTDSPPGRLPDLDQLVFLQR